MLSPPYDMVQGHSTKSIARSLDVAPGTVKVRRNIHQKFGIKSQSELFARCIEIIESRR
jgi:DNA-binding CsgD family transcriptional regulator